MRPVVRRLLNARAASLPALSTRSISSRGVLTIANSTPTARAGPAVLRRGSAVVRGRGLATRGGDGGDGHSFKIALLSTVLAVAALDDGTIFYGLGDHVGLPLLKLLDPEEAHDWAIKALASGWLPRNHSRWGDKSKEEVLAVKGLWGLEWGNVVGIAAGFDKHAMAMQGLLDLGAGFVEVGSVTPQPQPGNPKPRMFRLVEDRGVINRYGFNSEGMHAAEARLKAYRSQDPSAVRSKGVIGVNAGKNKTTEHAEDDYRAVAEQLGGYADYLVINVSSPNTPGLRALQQAQAMKDIIHKVMQAPALAKNYCGRRVPVLVKVAPDLTPTELDNIAQVVLETKVDGLIVSNTTIARPDSLKSEHKGETGGLSGAPVRDLSTSIIRELYVRTQGKVPIIGVGGIANGQDAYDKIRAGATLVQVYSMLVYEGPGAIRRIKEQLAQLLQRDGFRSVSEAVGADVVLPPPTGKNARILAVDEAANAAPGQRKWYRLWLW